jgi:pyridoxamine 5'-phosphate oxidase
MTNPGINLAQIRSDYQLAALNEKETGDDPVSFFEKWLLQAQDAKITEVNAMALSTVDDSGKPHSRIVLLKGLENGGLIFFTNYDSAKGRQMAGNNQAALLFFWKELERQVRIEGRIDKISAAASDRYFHSRPKGSQLSAAVSPQSQVITGRKILEEKAGQLENDYKDKEIPRPENWGGYTLIPHYMEFWQGRNSRLHDRIAFEKKEDGLWSRYRLAP